MSTRRISLLMFLVAVGLAIVALPVLRKEPQRKPTCHATVNQWPCDLTVTLAGGVTIK